MNFHKISSIKRYYFLLKKQVKEFKLLDFYTFDKGFRKNNQFLINFLGVFKVDKKILI